MGQESIAKSHPLDVSSQEKTTPVNRFEQVTADTSFYFNTKMVHVNSYALSRAIAKTMGDAQAVLMNDYARNVLKLSKIFQFELFDTKSYLEYLGKTRQVLSVSVMQERPNLVSFDVKVCSIAKNVHNSLSMSGYSGDICPLAMLFMVAKANEMGWTPSGDLFDFIRFSGKLSYFTDTGCKTEFELVKKET